MAMMSNIANKSFKWLTSNKNTLRSLSLPALFLRPSKSKSNSSDLFPNNSWPRTKSTTTTRSKEDELILQQVFCFFDENKDGKISVEELRAYFVSVGDSMSHEEAARVINEFDKDGDSLLEFGDFVELIEQEDDEEERQQKEDYVKKAFEMFVEVENKGGSVSGGCITPKGLQQVLKRLGNAKSFEECRAMIRVYDLDGNGVVDFNEFQRMMST